MRSRAAAANGTARLTEHGFHLAMLVTGALMCVGGVIGGVGIRNPKDGLAESVG
jgi:hypothetical protein